MPTIDEGKPAKPRPQRSRKTEQRNPKSAQKVAARPDSGAIDPAVAPIESAAIEAAPAEVVPLAIAVEPVREEALSGEVLPPEIRAHAPRAAGAQAIALAYGDYTQKSWVASRFLVERMITVRSFDEAIEIQGEFAKQTYANFLVHSERICALYSEWARQLLRPFDKFAARP
jgi:hypothetical protein